jgi:hypothetical protein
MIVVIDNHTFEAVVVQASEPGSTSTLGTVVRPSDRSSPRRYRLM